MNFRETKITPIAFFAHYWIFTIWFCDYRKKVLQMSKKFKKVIKTCKVWHEFFFKIYNYEFNIKYNIFYKVSALMLFHFSSTFFFEFLVIFVILLDFFMFLVIFWVASFLEFCFDFSKTSYSSSLSERKSESKLSMLYKMPNFNKEDADLTSNSSCYISCLFSKVFFPLNFNCEMRTLELFLLQPKHLWCFLLCLNSLKHL
jgi:hypothetical protein